MKYFFISSSLPSNIISFDSKFSFSIGRFTLCFNWVLKSEFEEEESNIESIEQILLDYINDNDELYEIKE